MRIAITRPLFDWQSLEDSPTLASLRELLASIPDAQLLEGLAQHRGRGRDDYPVTVLWGVVVLTALLRHKDFEACLAELRRNEGLRQLIDIPDENRVPKPWNISRFMAVLGREPHRTRLVEIFDQMARRLAAVVPSLGRHLAGDATALKAKKLRDAQAEAAETADGLPQPSGGRKEYRDDAGKVTEVYEWFGYKLHLLVDVKHEVAAAYTVTAPSAGDGEGWPCPSEVICNAGRSFGKTVRIKCELDLRRFPPIPRATKQFERRYKGRTAIERVNGRLKVFWGADDGNLVGARRFHALVGVVMLAHLAFATQLAAAPRREGTLGKMRLSPIARKLRQVRKE